MQRKFRGEDQWMLPSVSKKIDASSESSSSKKKEKKSKKSKKSSKKHKKEKKKSKKKKRSISSDSDGSSAEERISKKKHKRKHFSDASSDSSSSESDEEDAWVEKGSENKGNAEIETKRIPDQAPSTNQREDWLGGLSSIRTFSKSAQDEKPKKDDRKGIDSYEPGKSVRELNPYWRDGGDGLPKAFAKPSYDSDSNDEDSRRSYRVKQSESARSSNWKKRSEPQQSNPSMSAARAATITSSKDGSSRKRTPDSSSSSSRSPTPERKSPEQSTSQASRDDFLTDQQMNELGAKLVKAEIMGNDGLAQELKDKLDRARKFRSEHKSEVLAKSFERRTQGATQNKREKEENVVLTTTNSKGQSRPVASFRDDSDLWGGRAGRKAKKQKVETHLDGERVRYFADDDKYDIKRMVSISFNHSSIVLYSNLQNYFYLQFEAEKFTSANDSDMQFANIAGKHKNPNDDLEDIFADKVRKNVTDDDMDKKERDRAIREHQEMERTLNACEKCFDSLKLEKQLIVSLGKNVYLSLPWHEGLTNNHCLITPLAHVPCSTQLEGSSIRDTLGVY